MRVPRQIPPTHKMMIEVPINLKLLPGEVTDSDMQAAFGEAVTVVMKVIRLGTLGMLCDDPMVTIVEVDPLKQEGEKSG